MIIDKRRVFASFYVEYDVCDVFDFILSRIAQKIDIMFILTLGASSFVIN